MVSPRTLEEINGLVPKKKEDDLKLQPLPTLETAGMSADDIRYVQLIKEFNHRGMVADAGLPVGASQADQNAAMEEVLRLRGTREPTGDILQVPQNITETIVGLGFSAFEPRTRAKAKELRAQGVPSSIASTQAYRQVDQPSARIPITPGAIIEAIFPGTPDVLTGKGRGLSRADVGVKGGAELLADPINIGLAAGPALRGAKALATAGGRAAVKQAPRVAAGGKRLLAEERGGLRLTPEEMIPEERLPGAVTPVEQDPILRAVVDKWQAAKARNSARATRDLDDLKAKGFETENAEDALKEYKDTNLRDFSGEGRELDFAEARSEAWDDFVHALDDIEPVEVPGEARAVVREPAPPVVSEAATPPPQVPPAPGQRPPTPPEEPTSVFAKFLESPATLDAWEKTKALRAQELGERIGNFQSRAEMLVTEGKSAEDAIGQALGETMAGVLPSAEGGLAGSFTAEMRTALFKKVYDTLRDEPFEMISTSEALKNALLGKAIPREPGVAGQSAYGRLLRVFGKEPEVMKILDEPVALKEQVDRALLTSGKAPVGVTARLPEAPDVPFGQARYQTGERAILPEIAEKSADQIVTETLQLRLKLMGAQPGVDITKEGARVANELMERGSQAFLMPPDATPLLMRALSGVGHGAQDIGNLVRANISSVDFSWWRQQLPLIFNNKRDFMRANVGAWHSIWSGKAARESWDKITRDPLYQLYVRQGKDFLRPLELKPGQAQFEGVEEFGYLTGERAIPRFTGRLPWVKVSQRVFVTGANEHNWNIYKRWYQLMLKQQERIATGEITMPAGQAFSVEKNMEAFAKMLMDFTGRADLGRAKKLAPMLSGFFFAPRFALGRALTARHLWSSNGYVRKEAWKNLGAMVGVIGPFLIVGKEMGLWDVEVDPRSSDFAKIRIGNIRIDPWGGLQPLVRLLFQVATNSGKSIRTGRPFRADPVQSIGRFIRGKASPLLSFITDLKTGKTFIGEKLDPRKVDQWMERILPMTIMDIWDGIRESGLAGGAIAGIPSLFGSGVGVHLEDVAGESNRQFNELPGVNRLGVYLGIVPKTFNLGPRLGGEVDLSEEEQKEYQALMASIVTPDIARFVETPSFARNADNPERQEKTLRARITRLKARARNQYRGILLQRRSGQPQQAAPVTTQPQQQTQAPAPTTGGVSPEVLERIMELHRSLEPAGVP